MTALLIGLIVFAYEWNASRKISQYEHSMLSNSPKTLVDYLAMIKNAPDAVCHLSSSSFQHAGSAVVYSTAGRSRVDLTDISSGTVIHQIYDVNGVYAWGDEGPVVHIGVNEPIPPNNDIGLVNTASCERWKVNDAAFEVPFGRVVQEL